MEKISIKKAKAYIANRLADRTWRDGDRLPSLTDLANGADVSRTSMWKAVTDLKKEKLRREWEAGYMPGRKSRTPAALKPTRTAGHGN
jgi:DNA-binding GntR family transcriptional regulator